VFKYLIIFVLSSPLIGIWLVESGEPSLTIGIPGEENGATVAYSLYILLILTVAFGVAALRVGRRSAAPTSWGTQAERAFAHFSVRFMVLNCVFLLVMLFVFGGIQVWLGTIEKGQFRTGLGPLGALPFLMTKFAVPALFAYSTMLWMKTRRSRGTTAMWFGNALIVFLAGSTWGFKTTGLFMLLPGLLILNWRLPVYRLLLFAGIFVGSLFFFFFLFDAHLMDDIEVFTFLGSRLTILQGDVPWYVWGLKQSGELLPNYWPTLLAAVGDTILAIFISRNDANEWLAYHYDWMLTHLSGSSLDAVINGHSVTGTPFAEGVIAGGSWGVALFAVVAGLLVGGFYSAIASAIRGGRSLPAALQSTYFCFHIFSWLNGGGITQLFHISVVANILIAYFLIRIMSVQPIARRATIPYFGEIK
jgi:hypothetical protein